MKFVAAAFAYLVALAVTAIVSFFSVLLIAGPHAGLLASWLEPVVLVVGWLVVLLVPVLVVRVVWRCLCRTEAVTRSAEGQRETR